MRTSPEPDSAPRERMSPRLLVSVRSAVEARQAIAGGCDVLDVKDPSHGALGMADVAAIAEIASLRDQLCPNLPLSVALGEVIDREVSGTPARLPAGIAWLKLGTAGLGAGSNWRERFAAVRERFVEQTVVGQAVPDVIAGQSRLDRAIPSPAWIAVAYADWRFAEGPAPAEVLAAAASLGCAGMLIDTFSKRSGSLFDWCSRDELAALALEARRQNLLFALAGRLSLADVPKLREIAPDVVGIRSAACRDGRRDREIDADAIRAFRQALREGTPLETIMPGGKRSCLGAHFSPR